MKKDSALQTNIPKNHKKHYQKPAILSLEELEVMASACNPGNKTAAGGCSIPGEPTGVNS